MSVTESSDMSNVVCKETLLPNEPRIIDEVKQHELTERFLMPALPHLEAFFLDIRAQLDPILCAARPFKAGKPYPLGQCLEISQAVQERLQHINFPLLNASAAQGYIALAMFQSHGGSIRQVWGDLRGQYFQNAFLVGTLYIDTSNDTVVPTKPKVEILPFAKAQFSPIRDYQHYMHIASRYWGAQMYPNYLIPSLAPYFPLISFTPKKGVHFESSSSYMLALTRRNAFRTSKDVLNTVFDNEDVFRLLANYAIGISAYVAQSREEGSDLALQYCQQYSAKGLHYSDECCIEAMKTMLEVTKRLALVRVQSASQNVV